MIQCKVEAHGFKLIFLVVILGIAACAGSSMQGHVQVPGRDKAPDNKPSGDGRRPSEQGEGIAGYLTNPSQVNFQSEGSDWIIDVKNGSIQPQQDSAGARVHVCIQTLVAEAAESLKSSRGTLSAGPDLLTISKGISNADGGFAGRIPIPKVTKDSVLVLNVSSQCSSSGLALEEDGKVTAILGPTIKPSASMPTLTKSLNLPIITPQIAVPDRPFSYRLQGKSSEGLPLTYRCLRDCPVGLVVDPSTGTVSWTPPDSLAGQSRSVVLAASDGEQQKEVPMALQIGVVCGADLASNCYSGKDAEKARETGFAVTPSGKRLVWTLRIEVGFWSEKGGNRLLKVDGTDGWATGLSPDGRTRSAEELDYRTSNIISRICPLNVFVPAGDPDAGPAVPGHCLYYDGGNPRQALNQVGTSQTNLGTIGLGVWNTPASGNGSGSSWYEGNIQTCAAKGMRLPTLFETSSTDPSSQDPVKRGAPRDPVVVRFSGPGVGVPPANGNQWTWTASSRTIPPGPLGEQVVDLYWAWAGSGTAGWAAYTPTPGGSLWGFVRCIVP
jgi:hypothetical protein